MRNKCEKSGYPSGNSSGVCAERMTAEGSIHEVKMWPPKHPILGLGFLLFQEGKPVWMTLGASGWKQRVRYLLGWLPGLVEGVEPSHSPDAEVVS